MRGSEKKRVDSLRRERGTESSVQGKRALCPAMGRREAGNLCHQPVTVWGSPDSVSSVVGGVAVGMHVRGPWEQDRCRGYTATG